MNVASPWASHFRAAVPVALDVHPHLGLREVRLHVRSALGLLSFDALVLSRLLHLVGGHLLIGNIPLRQHLHQLPWEDHCLDIDAARFDPIFRQFFFDVLESLFHRFTGGNEAHRGHAFSYRKMVTRALQHLVDEVRFQPWR